MSLGTILLILLVIFLLGGFSGRFGVGQVTITVETDNESFTFSYDIGGNYERFVAEDGDDDGGLNSCLVEADPCATIQQAVDRYNNVDTLLIGVGEFVVGVNVVKKNINIL